MSFQSQNGITHRDADSTHFEQGVIVFGIANADNILRRHIHLTKRCG